MKNLLKLAIATLLSLNLLSLPAQAKVVVKYDEFKDETTISIVPEKIDPKRPQLSLSKSFRGKKPTEMPYSFEFGLQVHQQHIDYAHRQKCENIRIRILADGKAARNPPLPFANMREIGISIVPLAWENPKSPWENPSLAEYMLLTEYFQANVFKQIVQAKIVKYRLCDSDSEIFELTTQEKSDLKKFYSFFEQK